MCVSSVSVLKRIHLEEKAYRNTCAEHTEVPVK